jgi:hypothetical protein
MWSKLNFGKHQGKSLPQVILTDPDWFFWATETRVFDNWPALRAEANDILRKATQIKIPKPDPKKWEIEYIMQPDGKFSRFQIVEATRPSHVGSSITARDTHLDLSFVRRRNAYDKVGNKRMLQCFKHYYFRNASLTKRRCEGFFTNSKNFVKETRPRVADQKTSNR